MIHQVSSTSKVTWLGLLVADAKRVMEMELVFDAKIAEPFRIVSN